MFIKIKPHQKDAAVKLPVLLRVGGMAKRVVEIMSAKDGKNFSTGKSIFLIENPRLGFCG